MQKRDEHELWAMQRAEQIVLSEGMTLMQMAQSLDRKNTAKASSALREAIRQSLVEALANALEEEQTAALTRDFDAEVASRIAVIDDMTGGNAIIPAAANAGGKLPSLLKFRVKVAA